MIITIILISILLIAVIVACKVAYKRGHSIGLIDQQALIEKNMGIMAQQVSPNQLAAVSAMWGNVAKFNPKIDKDQIIRDLYNDRDDHDKTIAIIKNPEIAEIIKGS
jgi:hypothetical protein